MRRSCASFHFASHVARAGGKIRFYVFNHEPSYLTPMLKWLGAYHGVEIDFIFNAPSGSATDEEIELSHEIQRLWIEFIKDENRPVTTYPTSSGPTHHQAASPIHVSDWPHYNNESRACVILQKDPIRIVPDCVPASCALWDSMMQRGIIRVPPGFPEPLLSVMANVWGPALITTLTNQSKKIVSVLGAIIFTGLAIWGGRRFMSKTGVAAWRSLSHQ